MWLSKMSGCSPPPEILKTRNFRWEKAKELNSGNKQTLKGRHREEMAATSVKCERLVSNFSTWR